MAAARVVLAGRPRRHRRYPLSVGQLKLAPNAQLVIAGIEKEIGLDKLGVSLDTVINAIIDPMGKDNDKLNAALEKKIGMDDDGLYRRR